MIKFLQLFLRKKDGSMVIEYAILGALLAVACLGVLQGTSTEVRAMFNRIGDGFETAVSVPNGVNSQNQNNQNGSGSSQTKPIFTPVSSQPNTTTTNTSKKNSKSVKASKSKRT